jgi:dTDP-4-amino-4,6-dideoxygalactose transaminase
MSEVRDADYESASAQVVGARHAVAFGFARHALSTVLVCAGLEAADEVALSPLTCKVVPLALLSAGLRPIYVDVTPGTLNLDPNRLEDRLGPKTRAVMFQHTYGGDAGIEDVARVADRRGCLLVEDCAQCLPMATPNRAPARLGRAAIFSNNLLKPLPAGSGGLLTTNDAALADAIRAARDRLPRRSSGAEAVRRIETWLYRLMVRPSSYWTILEAYKRLSPGYRERPVAEELEHEIVRLAFRPSSSQLRAGTVWLERLTAIARHRQSCCADYRRRLSGRPGIDIPPIGLDRPLLYFPVLTPRKQAALAAAKAKRLPIIPWPGSTPMYPIERLEALRSYGYEPGSCPVAESIASRLIGLPTEPDITPDHRQRIADLVTAVAAA